MSTTEHPTAEPTDACTLSPQGFIARWSKATRCPRCRRALFRRGATWLHVERRQP